MFLLFLLGIVLVHFEPIIGMPAPILYFLCAIAGLFIINSFYGYFQFGDHWRTRLKIIALANLSYCCITLGLVFYLHESLTHWGILYFVFEVIVIAGLSFIELAVAAR